MKKIIVLAVAVVAIVALFAGVSTFRAVECQFQSKAQQLRALDAESR